MINTSDEIAALDRLSTSELYDRYAELFGQPVRTRHKQYLVRKIAWRLQAVAEGDLSERSRKRAAELANDRQGDAYDKRQVFSELSCGRACVQGPSEPYHTRGRKAVWLRQVAGLQM